MDDTSACAGSSSAMLEMATGACCIATGLERTRDRVRKDLAKDEERLNVVTGDEVPMDLSAVRLTNFLRSRECFERDGKRVTMRVAKLLIDESPDLRRLMVWLELRSPSLEKPSRIS